jgi:hypothetical protein
MKGTDGTRDSQSKRQKSMDDFNVETIVMLPLFLNESSKVQTDWLVLALNSMNSHIGPRQTQAMSVKGKKNDPNGG